MLVVKYVLTFLNYAHFCYKYIDKFVLQMLHRTFNK
jgi:hypothetical protein